MTQSKRRTAPKAGLAILYSVLCSSLSLCKGGDLAAEKETSFLRSSLHPSDEKIDVTFDLPEKWEEDHDELLDYELDQNEANVEQEITDMEEATGRRKLTWYVTLWTSIHGPPPPPHHKHHHSDNNGKNGGGKNVNGGNGDGNDSDSDGNNAEGRSGSNGGNWGSSGYWDSSGNWVSGANGDNSSNGDSSSYSGGSNSGSNGSDTWSSWLSGSSGEGSASGSGSGTDTGEIFYAENRKVTQSQSTVMMLVAAVAASCAIAAVIIGQRQAARPRHHGLHGAVKNRMRLFSGFADRALCNIQRPPREVEIAPSQDVANYGQLA